MSKGRFALAMLAGIAYAGLSHGLMLYAADQPWAIAALLGPALMMLTGMALRRRHVPGLLVCVAVIAAVGWIASHGGLGDVNRLYVVQHAGIHLVLCGSFAATLRGRRLSMIGIFAERVHGRLADAMVRYTWGVTAVWSAYFLAMAAASCWVYAHAPWAIWSLLANVITPVCIGLLFVGEHLVRYRLHPDFERASLADAWRAYNQPVVRGEAAGS